MTDNRKQLSASNFRLDTTPEAISDFIESVEIAIPGTKMSKALQNRFHHMHLRTAMLQRQNDFKKEKVKAYRSQLPDPKEKLEKLREREKTVDEKISEKKQEKMAQQQAKSSYLERHRHVVKMTHRQSIIEEEKKGFIVRRQLKEEKLLEDILQDSFKRQREQRIEEHKLNQEREKAVKGGEKKRKEARLKYLRDQISVLEEQLQEIKREEELAKKAKNEVQHKLKREAKIAARKDIERMKSRLRNEEEHDFIFRVRDAEIVKDQIAIQSESDRRKKRDRG